MLRECFEHQTPEAFGRREVAEPLLPPEFRDDMEDAGALQVVRPEMFVPLPPEIMGHPDARRL
jgi:hypothetical protein